MAAWGAAASQVPVHLTAAEIVSGSVQVYVPEDHNASKGSYLHPIRCRNVDTS